MVRLLGMVLALLLFASPSHAVIELDVDSNDAIDVVYGGTNAATAADARTNLGLAIGTDVQAYNAMLASWASYGDPGVNRLLYWNDTAGAFQSYVPSPWTIPYFAGASALTELSLGAQYTVLQSGGAAAAPSWTATLNWDPLYAPYGANPTVDAAGKIAIDTSSGAGAGWRFFADAAYQLPGYQVGPPVIVKSPDAGSDYPIFRSPWAITLKAVHYICTGGTSWTGQLQECDANGANGVDTQAADTTAAAATVSDVTSFSNASIDAGDWVCLKTTSISGLPTSIAVSWEYTVNLVN